MFPQVSFSIFLKKLLDFGSNPIFREKFPQCAENIVCYVLRINLKQICLGSVCICPTFQINPFIVFLGFEICCYPQQLGLVFCLSFGCTSRKAKLLLLIQKFSFSTKFLFDLFLNEKLFCMTYIHFLLKKNRF